ncbi:Glu-tRNA(Gln) amidotransferase GatDE subunit D, partial [Candidatus Woesearchaeota archaeon]
MKPGDKVRILVDDEELVGIYLPRPELLDPNIFVLKLENGYNIGIDRSKIQSHEVLESYVPVSKQKKPLQPNSSLPTVSILSFGGTIASKVDYRTGGVSASYDASDFVEM